MPVGAGAAAADMVGATGAAGGFATQSCELTVLIACLKLLPKCVSKTYIKPYMITKLKMAGIQSVLHLAISIPHQLVDIGDGMLEL
jgi:hypothetical protein